MNNSFQQKDRKLGEVLKKFGVSEGNTTRLELLKKEIWGIIFCEFCCGTKRRRCTRCNGDPGYNDDCYKCRGSLKEKKQRKVDGFMTCDRCGGSGAEPREYYPCDKCDGSKKMPKHEVYFIECTACIKNPGKESCSMCSGKLTIKCYKCK